MIIYLAGPIDYAGGDKRTTKTRKQLTEYLTSIGHCVYNPATAWTLSPKATAEPTVQNINNIALDQADAIVAVLYPDIPTIGTILEINQAYQQGKIVIIWNENRDFKNSWSLAPYDDIHHAATYPALWLALREG